MRSVNFVILGDATIADNLGKKGTATDITLYDKKDADIIRTFIVPNGFPEKIQPLLQAINLAEYVIFNVNVIDKFTGEQIVALDILKKSKGILLHTYDIDENKLNLMIKGTVLEQFKRVSHDRIQEEVNEFEPNTPESPQSLVVVDHCFDVKGVGTVILGKVISGTIKQYDKLVIYPSNKEVLIKSIQMHDNPVKESVAPARVGIALKDVSSQEISRGDYITTKEMRPLKELQLDFQKSPFFKDELKENQMYIINVGLQTRSAKVLSLNPFKLHLDKPVVSGPKDVCMVLKPESTNIRIVGCGGLLED